ncbi:MAG: hypothetical protein WEB87_02705 [Bacteriovoracaceae bacterium]
MSKAWLLIWTLLSSSLALCQSTTLNKSAPLEGFKVKQANFSHELELLAAHLEGSKLSQDLAQEVVGAAALINADLKKTPKSNALFLIKSEIYKGLLDNQRLSYSDKALMREALVKGVEQKLKKNKIVYTPFATWIVSSVLSELSAYRGDGFLDRYQTISRNDLKEKAKALQLEKLVKYLSPWIIAFNEKTPQEFNHLVALVSVDLLKRISKKTFYFKEYSSSHSEASFDELFAIPDLKIGNKARIPMPESSLGAQSQKKVEEVREVLDTLNKDDLENPSEAINILLQKEDSPSEDSGWKPQ